jgi:hypothetical protein
MVSVIVPVTERPAPLDGLYEELAAPLRASGRPYEFIFVTEPWGRSLASGLAALAASGEPVRVLLTGQTVGETAQIKLALKDCRGEIVVIHPAYPRIEPAGLSAIIARVEGGIDVVTARRWPRGDAWINRAQTWAFHGLIAGLGAGRLRDLGSGVRAGRRDVLRSIPLYGDFARFLPLAAQREGYTVEEIPVPQHPEERRARIYSPGIYLRRLIDVIGLVFLLRFTEKPLRFFGLAGALLSAAGGAILVVLAIQRLGGQALSDRPLLLFGLLLLVLGIQAIALGLIGEIIVHLHASQRRTYRLAGRDAP